MVSANRSMVTQHGFGQCLGTAVRYLCLPLSPRAGRHNTLPDIQLASTVGV